MLIYVIINTSYPLDRLHYVNCVDLGSNNSNLCPIFSYKRGLVHLTHDVPAQMPSESCYSRPYNSLGVPIIYRMQDKV